MKAPAECSTELIYSWIYITYCVCIYKRGNELSWDSPLGGWSRVKVRVSQHRAHVRGATPKLESSSREGHCFAWFLAARRCPRKSWIHCGPWEMQAEPLGLSTVGTPAWPSESATGAAPALGGEGRGARTRARWTRFLWRSRCSPTSLYQVPRWCSWRHLLTDRPRPAPRPGWGRAGWGNGQRGLRLYWTLGLSVTYSLLWGRTLNSLGRTTSGLCVLIPASEAGATNLPSLCPRWRLLAAAHWRPVWGTSSVRDVQRVGRAAWGTCSMRDVQREGRAAWGTSSVWDVQRGQRPAWAASEVESAWRRLGSEGLEAKSDVKAKHLSLHWWILFLNFAESVECLSKH